MKDLFHINFENAGEEERQLLRRFFTATDYRGAGYTYLSTYIWRRSYCISWEVFDGYLCMAGADCTGQGKDAVMAMPLTSDGTYEPSALRTAILSAKERFDMAGLPFRIATIPAHLVPVLQEAFGKDILLTHDRDNDEYVYMKDKLINLSGRALHKKKNHLNYFLRTYPYTARTLTLADRAEIMDFAATFMENKVYAAEDQLNLEREFDAIDQMTSCLEYDNIYTVGIYMNGHLKAFAIGERLSADTAVEHFEKADDMYRGLYQLICREFCAHLPEDILYVNREEDMGMENLRQAKEALRPDRMEEKYNARLL